MMSRYFYTIVALAVMVAGCRKKPLPEPVPGLPVFSFAGKLDGSAVDMKAGDEGYFMSSSHYTDSAGTIVFKGQLSQPGCGPCGYGVTVLVKDIGPGTAGANIESSLKPGHYLFDDITPSATHYNAKIRPDLAFDPAGTYDWTVTPLDGTSPLTFAGYEFQGVLKGDVRHRVEMKFQDPTGCEAIHTNYYVPSAKFTATVTAKKNPSQSIVQYTFSSSTSSAASNCVWDYGDGTPHGYSKWNQEHTFAALPGGGWYTVMLKTFNSAGDSCVSYYQVAGVPEDICTSNFRASFIPIPVPTLYSRVTVLVTEPSGEVLSSAEVDQPATSDFEIVSSSPYDPNEKSEPTRRLSLRFNCLVGHGAKKVQLTEGQAVMAVSY
jgi:hypothetical protein